MTDLVRSGRPDEQDLDGLRARVHELDTALAERGAEIAGVKVELDAFRIRYRHDVGLLHEELDELERAIAAAELGELSKLVEDDDDRDSKAPPANPDPDVTPRLTSDAVRRLFRDVAKIIHPDLAGDADTRDRRHALMVEANRAYALGDEERLRWILQAWANSPDAVQGSDPESMRLRLVRRIAESEAQLDVFTSDLAALKDSPLWKLKAMVDEAAARGKDLMSDTVRRLKRDIVAARNRLDAMTWHP